MKILSPLHPIRAEKLKQYIKRLPGLVAYYPLNEDSGAVAYNHAPATKGTLNGTITGATPKQAGQAGRAMSFDGVDDNVKAEITLSQEISIGIILQTSSANRKFALISTTEISRNTADGFGGDEELDIGFDLGGYVVFLRENGLDFISSSTSLGGTNNGNYYMFVVTINCTSRDVYGYRNGIQVMSMTMSGSPNLTNFITATIGGVNPVGSSRYWNGKIQHPFFVNGILTAAQVLKMAQIAGLA